MPELRDRLVQYLPHGAPVPDGARIVELSDCHHATHGRLAVIDLPRRRRWIRLIGRLLMNPAPPNPAGSGRRSSS